MQAILTSNAVGLSQADDARAAEQAEFFVARRFEMRAVLVENVLDVAEREETGAGDGDVHRADAGGGIG